MDFYESLLKLFKLTLQMRNRRIKSDIDYLISPVSDAKGKFYKSIIEMERMVKFYSKSIMSNLKLFQEKSICSFWDEQEVQWYFSVIDVVAALTDSINPLDYWFKIKKR